MNEAKNVAILGSTGSVGKSALEVIAASKDALRAVGLSAHSNVALLEAQAREVKPRWVVATDEAAARQQDWSRLHPQTETLFGADAIEKLVRQEEVDIVLAAIVGSAGLRGAWAALDAGKTLALANKETLVVAGHLVMELARERGGAVLPVDSEHSAIFQALQAGRRNELKRIVLTASGGPFRALPLDRLEHVTVADALEHPTWDMGPKITIDSATMMNKALEIVEARWLFDLRADQIAVMIHPQSVVHSLVEFVDGSVVAQLSPPDMRLPIQYALTYPRRTAGIAEQIDWTAAQRWTFDPPDLERFPAIALGLEAAERGGTCGAALNGANEAAVAAFLAGELKFTEIVPAVRSVLHQHEYDPRPSLDALMAVDRWGAKGVGPLGFDLIAFWLIDPSAWSVIMQVAVGLGAVIFIHELGHFAVAKACGVKCEKFYLGFDIGGMKLAKFQWGETEYGIGILPLGGYVKMLGQDDNPNQMTAENERARAKSDAPPAGSDVQVSGAASADVKNPGPYDPRSYMAKSVPQRMAIISAGVIMNVIFAFFVGSIAYGLGVKEAPATVSQTVAGDPAWTAGVQAGDEITRINDVGNPRYRDLQTHVSAANLSKGVELEIRRPGVEAPIVLNIMPDKGATQQLPTIGITSGAELTVAGIEDSALAKKSGLQDGDRIEAIDGKPISTAAEWGAMLANRASDFVVATVRHPKKDKKGKPVIPLEYEGSPEAVRLEPQPLRTFGMEMEMGPIAGIQKGSPAEAAGLKRGDVLQTIEGDAVGNPLTLDARLRKHAGKSVRLTVKRAGVSDPVELTATLLKDVPVDAIVRVRGPVEAAALGAAFTVTPRVASVAPDSPAKRAGVEPGWVVKSVTFEWPNKESRSEQSYIPTTIDFLPAGSGNEANWPIVESLLTYLAKGASVRIEFTNDRQVAMTPEVSSEAFSTDRGIVLAPQTRLRKAASVGEAIKLGAAETRDALLQVYWFIQKLASGQISWKLIGGPGRIAVAAGSYAKKGFADYLLFLTLISANLAVVNFLPIPLLDGGHMVFLAAEGIRGKPLNERIVLWLTYLGLFFILGLMFLGITLDSIWGLKSFGWIEG